MQLSASSGAGAVDRPSERRLVRLTAVVNGDDWQVSPKMSYSICLRKDVDAHLLDLASGRRWFYVLIVAK
jgi:hypothetical protein